MSKVNNLDDFLKDLADGIRTATGSVAEIKAQDMRAKIESIPKMGADGGITPSGTLSINSSGTYDVTGYESVSVDVQITFTTGVFGYASIDNRVDVDEETVIYGYSGSFTVPGTIVGTPTITKVASNYNEVSVSGNTINYVIYGNSTYYPATAEITFTFKK